jgi:tyrosinase
MAANNFRIPYWDWASVPQMPDVVNAENLLVTTPSGARNISNPLIQYHFQEFPFDKKYFPSSKDVARDWYLASYSRTVRSPGADGSASNFLYANEVLENANLKNQVVSSHASWPPKCIYNCDCSNDNKYYALTKSADYDEFATGAVWGPSIENVHSVVHLAIGGAWGHMSQLSYSAFDPILYFYLFPAYNHLG